MRVVVYEAGDRVGGVVRTERRDGYLAELGPNSLAAPSPTVSALLSELGLEPEHRRRRRPRRGTGTSSSKNKLRAAADARPRSSSPPGCSPTAPSWRCSASRWWTPATRRSRRASPTFVRRRFNQEVLDYVANPFVGGIFAGDPEQLSVRHALPQLYGLERTHGSVIKAFGGMMRARKREDDGDPASWRRR